MQKAEQPPPPASDRAGAVLLGQTGFCPARLHFCRRCATIFSVSSWPSVRGPRRPLGCGQTGAEPRRLREGCRRSDAACCKQPGAARPPTTAECRGEPLPGVPVTAHREARPPGRRNSGGTVERSRQRMTGASSRAYVLRDEALFYFPCKPYLEKGILR